MLYFESVSHSIFLYLNNANHLSILLYLVSFSGKGFVGCNRFRRCITWLDHRIWLIPTHMPGEERQSYRPVDSCFYCVFCDSESAASYFSEHLDSWYLSVVRQQTSDFAILICHNGMTAINSDALISCKSSCTVFAAILHKIINDIVFGCRIIIDSLLKNIYYCLIHCSTFHLYYKQFVNRELRG